MSKLLRPVSSLKVDLRDILKNKLFQNFGKICSKLTNPYWYTFRLITVFICSWPSGHTIKGDIQDNHLSACELSHLSHHYHWLQTRLLRFPVLEMKQYIYALRVGRETVIMIFSMRNDYATQQTKSLSWWVDTFFEWGKIRICLKLPNEVRDKVKSSECNYCWWK